MSSKIRTNYFHKGTLLLTIVSVFFGGVIASTPEARAEDTTARLAFRGRPVNVHLFTRRLALGKMGRTKDRKYTTIDGMPVLGAFGGLDPRVTYDELVVQIAGKGQKLHSAGRTRIVGPNLRSGDDDSPTVCISDEDGSILIIVSCGDAVVERIAIRIGVDGKLSRYVIEIRS